MNSREKFESAFSPHGAPEIPAVICYEGIFTRDHWPELSREPWWTQLVLDTRQQAAWRRQVAQAIDQDWFMLPGGSSSLERAFLSVEEREGQAYVCDARNGSKRAITRPRVGGWVGQEVASVRPLHPPHTLDGIDAWMASLGVVEDALSDGRADLPRQILATWGKNLYPLGYVTAPLWSCYRVWGFEEMMLALVDDPDLVHYAVRRWTERALRSVRVSARLGARGIWIEDCMTDMVSRAHFEQFNLRHLVEVTAEIRRLGMHSIHYFCGDPLGKWDALLASGADAVALEESKKRFVIDIGDVIERVAGRMAVLGNLDAIGVLEQGSEEELRTEIARQIAAGRRNGSRFVMSIGSPVTPKTPVSRVRLYIDLVHELGK
ncbi:MAG: hypothetical protein JXA89_23310 [Anaerolineae bacterium]|nr:hypothetical protein [Anaerolineae bacterium]